MNVIVRYILRELGLTFLIGFAVLTSLLLVIGLIQKALDSHIPLIFVVQLVPYVFAEMSAITLPVTLLLAVTIFFAKMAGNNEVVALKALGIHPKAFLIPVYMLAAALSIIAIGVNEFSITWGRQGINAITYRSAEEILLGQLRQAKQFDTANKNITIIAQGVDEQRRLIRPTIIFKREAITIEAQTAQIAIDFNANTMTITLIDFRVIGEGGGFVLAGAERIETIPLSQIMQTGERQSPSSMGIFEIQEERKKIIEQIEQQRRIIVAHRTFSASLGAVNDWAATEIAEAQQVIRRLQRNYARLSVEPPRRLATGFCCFFFVWLGAPLAIWMKKTDFFSSFFACFVPILILYYPLLMFGLDQAKLGAMSPSSVWLANLSIGLIGLWFLRQIHRY